MEKALSALGLNRDGKQKSLSPVHDMLLCAALTFMASVMYYEERFEFKIFDVYEAVLVVAMLAAWIWCGFSNGRKQKWSFPIFTACFWLLPQLMIFLSNNGPRIFRLNLVVYLLSEWSGTLVNTSCAVMGGYVGITVTAGIIIVMLLSMLAFVGGAFMRQFDSSEKR